MQPGFLSVDIEVSVMLRELQKKQYIPGGFLIKLFQCCLQVVFVSKFVTMY